MNPFHKKVASEIMNDYEYKMHDLFATNQVFLIVMIVTWLGYTH